jgi:hypothetical protein
MRQVCANAGESAASLLLPFEIRAMTLSDEWLIAAGLTALMLMPSALGSTLLSRSTPPEDTFSTLLVEEVSLLPATGDPNDERAAVSAESVMLDQLFEFEDP